MPPHGSPNKPPKFTVLDDNGDFIASASGRATPTRRISGGERLNFDHAADERDNRGASTHQRFGYGHPFWERAIELAKNMALPGEILAYAHAAGYTDLKVAHIRVGLHRAPADLNLPVPTINVLRERYREIVGDFDALATYKGLIEEGIRYLAEVDDELANLDVTEEPIFDLDRRTQLEEERHKWWKDTTAAVERFIARDDKLTGKDVPDYSVTAPIHPDDVAEARVRIIAELRQRIPKPPSSVLIDEFGPAHVRPPVEDDALIEGEVVELDGVEKAPL